MSLDNTGQRLWTLTGLLKSSSEDEPIPTTADLLRRRASRKGPVGPRWGLSWRRLAVAAVALLGAFAGGWYLHQPLTPASHLAAAEYSTGPNESSSITLGDGSIVRLAPRSRLRVLADPVDRTVWLSGQALFAVAKHQGRFVVRTIAGEAVALGTRFDLKARDGDLDLVVVEGRVALTAGNSRVEVASQQKASVRKNQLQGAPTSVDPERSRAWLGDFLVFQATPLGEAAVELSRHYRTPVRVLDSSLAQETVTGAFEKETLEDVVKVLCRSLGARCTVSRSGATIEP